VAFCVSTATAADPPFFDFFQLDRGQVIAFYTLDGNAYDSAQSNGEGSQLAHHGVIHGAVEAADGVDGRSMYFDGTSHIDVDLDISPSVFPVITIGAWVKVHAMSFGADDVDQRGSLQFLIGNDDGAVHTARGIALDATCKCWVATGGDDSSPIRGPQVVENVWTLVLASYDAHHSQVTLSVAGESLVGASTPLAGTPTMRIGSAMSSGSGLHAQVDSAFVIDAVISSKSITNLVHLFPAPLPIVPGTAGYAVQTTPSSEGFATVSQSEEWQYFPSMTFSVWVKLSSLPTRGYPMTVFSKVCRPDSMHPFAHSPHHIPFAGNLAQRS